MEDLAGERVRGVCVGILVVAGCGGEHGQGGGHEANFSSGPAPRAAPPELLKLRPSALHRTSHRLLPIPSSLLLRRLLIPSRWLLPMLFLHGCITNEPAGAYRKEADEEKNPALGGYL